MREIKNIRDQAAALPTAGSEHRPGVDAGRKAALTAKLADLRAENKELRRERDRAKAAAHQALGTHGSLLSTDDADALRQEVADLTVSLADTQRALRRSEEASNDLSEELRASHELNRDLVRRLTRAEEEARRARVEAGAERRRQTRDQ